jgi:hypothetical protein
MEQIILFADSKAAGKILSKMNKSGKQKLETLPHDDLRKYLRNPSPEILYLVDYASIRSEEKQKTIKYLKKKYQVPIGFIDRNNEIPDPAEIIFSGADYISGKLLREGLTTGRLKKFIEFHSDLFLRAEENDSIEETAGSRLGHNFKPVGGWESVKSGKEYPFFMFMTEISIPQEWKKKSGSDHLNFLKNTFQEVTERVTEPYGGRIWIWNDYGGLVLFPYEGPSSHPVVSGIKLLMNRVLVSVEDFSLHSPITLRAAMHLGETTYKARGKTGTIISDSINSIFHLGTKYTPLNDFDITEDVYKCLEARVKDLFTAAGSYEGRNIFRLRHFEIMD